MDVSDYLGVLRRRWIAVVVSLVVCVGAALAVTATTTKSYTSSARLFVNIPAARGVNEALQGVKLTSGLLQSYAAVATSRSAAQRIIDATGVNLSAGALSRKLSAVPEGETLLIKISASDKRPELAQQLATAAADVFVDIVDEFERGRSEKIEAQLIDAATVPSSPTSPKPVRNLILAVLVGLGLGFGAAFVLETLDRTVRTVHQASKSIGRAVLAVVPKRKQSSELVTADSTDAVGEAYRSLRTSIQFLAVDQPTSSILVTSPSPGDGKTTMAANLAVAFAQSGARVIVVDADLRRARLASMFGVDGTVGVTSVLTGSVRAADALQTWSPTLSILPAGPLPPNPAELAGSQAMADLLAQLGELADVVIADAPPVLPVTDAVALAAQVQAVVLVVRAGRTRRDLAHEASRRLDAVGAEVIGCVVNAMARSGSMPYDDDYRMHRDAAATRRTRLRRPSVDGTAEEVQA